MKTNFNQLNPIEGTPTGTSENKVSPYANCFCSFSLKLNTENTSAKRNESMHTGRLYYDGGKQNINKFCQMEQHLAPSDIHR